VEPAAPHQVGGLLSTAGNLVFSAPGGFMVASDPQTDAVVACDDSGRAH
jgi:hypothetical protein